MGGARSVGGAAIFQMGGPLGGPHPCWGGRPPKGPPYRKPWYAIKQTNVDRIYSKIHSVLMTTLICRSVKPGWTETPLTLFGRDQHADGKNDSRYSLFTFLN